jgi:hypothetical protein
MQYVRDVIRVKRQIETALNATFSLHSERVVL